MQLSCQVVISDTVPQRHDLRQTYGRFLSVEVTLLCNFLHTVAILGLACLRCPHGDKSNLDQNMFS